jgi:hypothetical protein
MAEITTMNITFKERLVRMQQKGLMETYGAEEFLDDCRSWRERRENHPYTYCWLNSNEKILVQRHTGMFEAWLKLQQ